MWGDNCLNALGKNPIWVRMEVGYGQSENKEQKGMRAEEPKGTDAGFRAFEAVKVVNWVFLEGDPSMIHSEPSELFLVVALLVPHPCVR